MVKSVTANTAEDKIIVVPVEWSDVEKKQIRKHGRIGLRIWSMSTLVGAYLISTVLFFTGVLAKLSAAVVLGVSATTLVGIATLLVTAIAGWAGYQYYKSKAQKAVLFKRQVAEIERELGACDALDALDAANARWRADDRFATFSKTEQTYLLQSVEKQYNTHKGTLTLRKEITELKSKTTTSSTSAPSVDAAEMRRLQDENRRLTSQLTSSSHQPLSVKAGGESGDAAGLRQTNEDLLQQLAASRSLQEQLGTENAQQVRELAQLKDLSAKLGGANQTLQTDLGRARATIDDLNARIKKLAPALERVTEGKQQAASEVEDLKGINERLLTQVSETTALREALKAAEGNLGKARQQLALQQEEQQKLQRQAETQKAEISSGLQLSAQLRAEIEKQSAEASRLQKQLSKTLDSSQAQLAEIQRLSLVVEKLKGVEQQKAALEQELALKTTSFEEAQHQLGMLTHQNQAQASEIESLQNQILVAKGQVQRVERAVHDAEDAFHDVGHTLETAELTAEQAQRQLGVPPLTTAFESGKSSAKQRKAQPQQLVDTAAVSDVTVAAAQQSKKSTKLVHNSTT